MATISVRDEIILPNRVWSVAILIPYIIYSSVVPRCPYSAHLQFLFSSDKPHEVGLPSVAYCARELNLSPNYFGDLITKETGKSEHEFIQLKLIDVVKERIFDSSKSLIEIA